MGRVCRLSPNPYDDKPFDKTHLAQAMADIEWKVQTGPELSTTDLYDILRLRVEIFTVEQNCPYQDLDGQDLGDNIYHIRAVSETNGLLAYIRVMYNNTEEKQVQIGRVVVEKNSRSIGLGRDLMMHALQLIEEKQSEYPSDTAMLHGQAYVRKYYESFGFEIEGEQFLEDDIPHWLFIKKLK